jgi:hypothetical protein
LVQGGMWGDGDTPYLAHDFWCVELASLEGLCNGSHASTETPNTR